MEGLRQQKVLLPAPEVIDLFANVHEIEHASLLEGTKQGQAKLIAARIAKARLLQQKRHNGIKMNAALSNSELKRHAALSPAAKVILDTAAERLGISARSYMRAIKVARTIADLDESPTIETRHITEALQFRRPETPQPL